MKKLSIALMFVGYIVIFLTFWSPPKNYTIILGKNGYEPRQVTISKGDSVKFITTLNSDFWPASDPHPTHTLYSGFDPGHEIAPKDLWVFRFDKVGNWQYHDHLNPNLRGSINVNEKNGISLLVDKISRFYYLKIQKHDIHFLENIDSRCKKPEWNQQAVFDECWQNAFAQITRDFGPVESIRLLKLAFDSAMIGESDCHNLADQIGIDSYWQYASGRKFIVTKDFNICINGFLHGFMLEKVSHGQDFVASKNFCDSLRVMDREMGRQCDQGMGIGLTFYYWGIFSEDLNKIVAESTKTCLKLYAAKSDCIYGVWGGVEHLLLGVHGAEIKVNTDNTYALCNSQKNKDYRNYCYERVSRPLFSEVNYNVDVMTNLFRMVPFVSSRQLIVNEFGDMLISLNIYDDSSAIYKSIEKCRLFNNILHSSCVEGVFTRLFYNLKELGGKFSASICNIQDLTKNESRICLEQFNKAKERI